MKISLNIFSIFLMGLVISGCDKISNIPTTGASLCANQTNINSIKSIVFDNAISTTGEDPTTINDWRATFTATVTMPLLQGVDEKLKRTDCSGRFVLTVPQTTRSKFGGESELKADITYFIQPSADGNGNIVHVDGIDFLVNKIVEANANANAAVIARQAEAQQIAEQAKANAIANIGGPQLAVTYNPSFDCSRRLNNTERMICQDEGLARLDRQLSDSFRYKVSLYYGAQKQALLAGQRQMLAQRAACPDINCLYQWYDKDIQWVNSLGQ